VIVYLKPEERWALLALACVAILACALLFLRGCGKAPQVEVVSSEEDLEAIPEPQPEEETLVVHVAGAVHEPGVYVMPGGSRAWDALEAAGGPTPEGAAHALNLAEPLEDGQRLYVPTREELERGEIAPLGQPSLVNLNRAGRQALETLPGIGPALAQRIIDDRKANGPFKSVDDLARVSGIGPKTVERLRHLVTVR
jgi:competence protein ComEA